MAELKVIGTDTPKTGQPLTPREAAIHRLQTQGVLGVGSEPLPRRKFIIRLAIAWLTFAAAIGGAVTTMFAFIVPRVDFTKIDVFKVGPPANFPPKSVDISFKAAHRVWIVNDHDRIFAIQSICTHLGCTPNWMPSEHKFKCPCHGSGYTMDGINFEGPAPYPMRRYEVSLSDDGQIIVNEGRLFYWEKGEFDNPLAYIAV